MTEAHREALVREVITKLDHKAFFVRLAALGITASDKLDAVASKRLGEDMANLCKTNGLETATHLYSRARGVHAIHELAGQSVNDKALKQMVDKLLGEQPEIYEALKTLEENPDSLTPIKPGTRKRAARTTILKKGKQP